MAFVAEFKDRFAEVIQDESYSSVGAKLDLSKASISAYVLGKRSPKTPIVKKIAQVYGVDPVWLMGMDVPKYKKTPEPEPESLSKDKAELVELINGLSDDEVSVVLSIVRQALALRGK